MTRLYGHILLSMKMKRLSMLFITWFKSILLTWHFTTNSKYELPQKNGKKWY